MGTEWETAEQVMASSPRILVAVVLALSAGSPAHGLVNNLKVMTFNVWVGEDSAAGRNKLVEIIQASGADVIGAQELGNSAGLAIAASLGFHYRQQSGGDIQVLSRYPIVGQSPGNLGVKIELSPGQQVWLFNAHLAPYPYQPYDLRDGILPMNEAAVISAATAARGSGVTSYLNDMQASLSSGLPVFFAGDFNEPSHLDWTAATAAATPRPFDLKVAYPASTRIVNAGMIDSLRVVRPDVVNDHAYTWTPGYPPPNLDANEVHDRIDIVYHAGLGVAPVSAQTVGYPDGSPSTDIAVAGYNADHRAVVVTYAMSAAVLGDFNGDSLLDGADWSILRTNQHADLSGLTGDQAYQRGDLNRDSRNDHTDFAEFKAIFDGLNGPGAFAAMVAAVPEPSGAPLLALGMLGIMARQRPRAPRPRK
jgi:endonuclease/exonuclease/phosphatase family metal-dependent hydrolase